MSDLKHLQELKEQYQNNLKKLEIQAAKHGMDIHLSILNAIEDQKKKIESLNEQIKQIENQTFSQIQQYSSPTQQPTQSHHVYYIQNTPSQSVTLNEPYSQSHKNRVNSYNPRPFLVVVIILLAWFTVFSLRGQNGSARLNFSRSFNYAISTPSPSKVSEAGITGMVSLVSRRFVYSIEKTYEIIPTDAINSSITGRVVRADKAGVAGAILYVNNGKRTVESYKTDVNGYFTINGLEAGHWSVVLNALPNTFGRLNQQVVGVVYVNGSSEQQAVINFIEQEPPDPTPTP